MTNKEITERIAALEAQAKKYQEDGEAILAQIAELKAKVKPEEAEWPQKGDKYYRVASDGRIWDEKWSDHDFDIAVKSIGNVFRTSEEAEFAAERLKVLAEMKRFAFEPDWSSKHQNKWYLYCNYANRTVGVFCTFNVCEGIPYFESKERAYEGIESIGEDRLLKYWFGV